jgi:hypothetical protein
MTIPPKAESPALAYARAGDSAFGKANPSANYLISNFSASIGTYLFSATL